MEMLLNTSQVGVLSPSTPPPLLGYLHCTAKVLDLVFNYNYSYLQAQCSYFYIKYYKSLT